MKIDRTTSFGLWRYASEFFESALLLRKEKGELYIPAYYMVCHSIELALKAYLRGSGRSLGSLRYKISHDLEKALYFAKTKCLSKQVKITAEFEAAIRMSNVYYKDKQFEYITVGSKTFPKIDILLKGASDLINGIKEYCLNKRKIHYKDTS